MPSMNSHSHSQRKDAEMMIHLMGSLIMDVLSMNCMYLHNHWGYSFVPAKLAHTNDRVIRALKIILLTPLGVITSLLEEVCIVGGFLAQDNGSML